MSRLVRDMLITSLKLKLFISWVSNHIVNNRAHANFTASTFLNDVHKTIYTYDVISVSVSHSWPQWPLMQTSRPRNRPKASHSSTCRCEIGDGLMHIHQKCFNTQIVLAIRTYLWMQYYFLLELIMQYLFLCYSVAYIEIINLSLLHHCITWNSHQWVH